MSLTRRARRGLTSGRRTLAVETTGPKTKKVGATYRGSLPDTDPIYKAGWNFLASANLNPFLPPPSDEKLEKEEKPPE